MGADGSTAGPLARISCPRPVDKLTWLPAACTGKRVLDLGAFDETAHEKRETGGWMHRRLAATAKEVLGVDAADALPEAGLETSPTSRIVRGDVYRLADLELAWDPDVIVAGELIEHLPDAVGFLAGIRDDPRLSRAPVIVTTPNACAAHNVLLGLTGRESTHPDHVAIHSYKTLSTVAARAGASAWTLQPYYVRFSEMVARERGVRRAATSAFQVLVNGVERAFPLLSAGWILTIDSWG